MSHVNFGQGIIPTGGISSFTTAAISFSSSGDNTVVAGAAGQTIRVFRLYLVCNAATSVTFKDANKNFSGALSMGANGGITFDFSPEAWFITASGSDFLINQTGTASIGGELWYQKS